MHTGRSGRNLKHSQARRSSSSEARQRRSVCTRPRFAVALGSKRVRYLDTASERCEAAAALGADVTLYEGAWPQRFDRALITVDNSGDPAGLACTLRSTDDYGFCTSVAIYFTPTTEVPLLDPDREVGDGRPGLARARNQTRTHPLNARRPAPPPQQLQTTPVEGVSKTPCSLASRVDSCLSLLELGGGARFWFCGSLRRCLDRPGP
jgi:hypothetical protein